MSSTNGIAGPAFLDDDGKIPASALPAVALNGVSLLSAWPVGAVYTSVVSTNPSTLFGGTWAAIAAGRVLVGINGSDTDFDSAEETGGSKTVSSTGSVSAAMFTGTSSQATSNVSAGTPAGANSAPTFTGSQLATHAHELPFKKATGATGALSMLPQATFGSGTSRASESISAAPTANTTSSAVALSEAKSAGTPAGSVSAPTFTGSPLGTHGHTITPAGTINAQSFSGNATSVVQPYLVVYIWKRTA